MGSREDRRANRSWLNEERTSNASQIASLRNTVANLETSGAEKDEVILQLNAASSLKDSRIAELEAACSQKNSRIVALEVALNLKNPSSEVGTGSLDSSRHFICKLVALPVFESCHWSC